jgi:phosphopantothenoylcysteine decarboxylase/phosphopantothenate--cysteine ligase
MEFPGVLKERRVVVAVSASIAVYKSLELVRLFIKAGAQVRVVMSEEAKRFVGPLSFEALSSNVVLHAQTESWANENNHIALATWAEVFVVAPATANTINKLSNGIADTLLLQTAIACKAPKILAPAANTAMLENPITQASLKMLKLNGYTPADEQSGLLACKVEGKGAMADPLQIFYLAARALLSDPYYALRGVVISGGGTIERLDDVRFVSNFSSGKMAKALVLQAYFKGGDVCYVTTRPDETLPRGVHQIAVESADEMAKAIEAAVAEAKKGVMTQATLLDASRPTLVQKKPFLLAAAAVSDYKPAAPQHGKLKKETLGETWNIAMKQGHDILAAIPREGLYKVGFKAEFDAETAQESAAKMLASKGLDAVCLNILGGDINFGSDASRMKVVTASGAFELEKASKLQIAEGILKTLKGLGE